MIRSYARPVIAVDGSTKYLATADDGACFEFVYFPWPGNETVCMSAQAGCGYGCLHCATTFATTRFQRSLSTSEIASSVRHVQKMHPESRLTTIDFSGTGDSSRNWVNVSVACQLLLAEDLCRTITITSIAPKNWVKRLLADDAWLPTGFLFSLHGATLAQRRSVIAFAEDPVSALPGWTQVSSRCPVTLNYVMHSGNTGPDDVRALAALLAEYNSFAGLRLCPLNAVQGSALRPASRPEEFVERVRSSLPDWRVQIAQPFGDDIDAACGQLRVRTRLLPLDGGTRLQSGANPGQRPEHAMFAN